MHSTAWDLASQKKRGAGTTRRSCSHFLSETTTSAGGDEDGTIFCKLFWWNREHGSSLFRVAGFKPVSPLASQGHPTRRPLNNLRGDILQLSRWSGALARPKSPRFKWSERERKEDYWAFVLVKRYSRWLKDPLPVSVVEAVRHTSQTSSQKGGCYV